MLNSFVSRNPDEKIRNEEKHEGKDTKTKNVHLVDIFILVSRLNVVLGGNPRDTMQPIRVHDRRLGLEVVQYARRVLSPLVCQRDVHVRACRGSLSTAAIRCGRQIEK